MFEKAKWIWSDNSDGRGYNLCSVFRYDFNLATVNNPVLRITADSWYRLKVNGQWCGDGPARAYPAHYSFDKYDLTGMLRAGANRIEVTVRYFGCGDFHQQIQRAALLAELECGEEIFGTGADWLCSRLPGWITGTAKSSIQKPPMEEFDFSRNEQYDWHPATELFDAAAPEAPWHGLTERETAPLTRAEKRLERFIGAQAVDKELLGFTIMPHNICFPGDTQVNAGDQCPVLMPLEIISPKAQRIRISTDNNYISVNGIPVEKDGGANLKEGSNLMMCRKEGGGHESVLSFGLPPDKGLDWRNLYTGNKELCVIMLPELTALGDDSIHWPWCDEPGNRYRKFVSEFSKYANRAAAVKTCGEFKALYPEYRILKENEYTLSNPHISFIAHSHGCVNGVPAGADTVQDPENLINGDDRWTTVNPVPGKDIELCYDFGEQDIGYWHFQICAPAGTVADFGAVEHILEDGVFQGTGVDCRNSMRVICAEGVNSHLSLMRRSGRYIFITLRRMTAPVKIRHLRLAESTYPMVRKGTFQCSDKLLEKIWEISERTLKLCMEDVFTDCPLYEQTLWVGDARNEGLFAMPLCGAYDLVRHCIRLAGQSLEQLPIVGCQVPSGWNAILPNWSFMWGISVWDYYYESGDAEFCREVWPMVTRNLDNALKMLDEKTGLFRLYAWNLFDWSKTDTGKPILLYNSMFLAGALNAAVRLGESIGTDTAVYADALVKLKRAVNAQWDRKEMAWPDWLDDDGKRSEDYSLHTSMLAVLYDLADEHNADLVRANTICPREELLPICSPFASQYYYEALEKLGMPQMIIESMYRDYTPMLKADATTVWETYPNSPLFADLDIPTRSHCHGWSAAPLYFLPRIILGIKPAAPGGKKFTVSPWTENLDYAKGSRVCAGGLVKVQWEKRDGRLKITAEAPEGVELEYLRNKTHDDLEVEFVRK